MKSILDTDNNYFYDLNPEPLLNMDYAIAEFRVDEEGNIKRRK